MTTRLQSLRHTGPNPWLLPPRLIAALPLAVFGGFHLTGLTPMLEILTRANIPFPEFHNLAAPILMVLAGLSMALGIYARLGAILGSGAMLVATYSKLVIEDWPGPVEPPLAMPIVVLLACLIVLINGPGPWSADRRATVAAQNSGGG